MIAAARGALVAAGLAMTCLLLTQNAKTPIESDAEADVEVETPLPPVPSPEQWHIAVPVNYQLLMSLKNCNRN